MADLAAYFSLVESHPELFRNPPDAGIAILLDEADIKAAEAVIAEQLRARGLPVEWAEVGLAYQDQYMTLLRDAVRFADGTLGTYIRTVAPGSRGFPGVVILPIWQGQVLVIRHFRHGTREWHLELPRGFGADPDPRVSAELELAEEIGAAGIELVPLGGQYPEGSSGRVAYFLANIESHGTPDAHEGISDIIPIPLAEFERKIADGELQDGYTLIAYGLAKARKAI